MTGKISDDAAADPTVAVTDAMCFAAEVALVNKGPKGSAIASYIASKTLTLLAKTIDAASNTISNLTTAMFAANVIDTDVTLAANSDTRLATQKAVKAYIASYIASIDAAVYKGVISCSGNPNYPAADAGNFYKVSTAGKIGGASGINVEIGDSIWCLVDSTASGTQAGVGANWDIIQVNIDGAVVGPASSVSGNFATFNGTSGKVVQDGGVILDTDGTLTANSDGRLASQKAVKTYVDTNRAGSNRIVNPSGQINQTGSGTAADATYWFDQWVQLNQSNPVTPSQLTNVANGLPFMMRTTQSNASAQRFGILQPIESANCIDLRGTVGVTLSALVRMSASTTLNYAILEWTGTADAPVIDVVNDWTNGSFTAGQFFNSTTLTVAAIGSSALTANALTAISLSIGAGSSLNNHMVIFWTNSTQAQNVTLDIGKVKFESGLVATPYAPRPYATELELCQRYQYVIAPGATGGIAAAGGVSDPTGYFPVVTPRAMLKAVTPTLSAASDWTVNPFASGSFQRTGSSVAFGNATVFGARVHLTVGTNTGATSGAFAELAAANGNAKVILKAQM